MPDSADLLAWYDVHARDLPWRIGPAGRRRGLKPEPYSVWLSEIMLQQTTVAAVQRYYTRFLDLWPDVGALAGAEDTMVMGEWAGLGYYARARNLLKTARIVAGEMSGCFPETLDGLRALPGIGPYTAAAIAAIAFDRPETVVDGNVERVMARVFAVKTPLPAAKAELRTLAAKLTPQTRPGDYAQAVMDLGAMICTPKRPSCIRCPWRVGCRANVDGVQRSLPARTPRQAKPVRFGIAYLARRSDGAWLLERRPAEGLLGGMLGWPGSDWGDTPLEDPPLAADWIDPGIEVRHTFTHFHLRLALRLARVDLDAHPWRGSFQSQCAFRPSDLPSVMRKAYDLATDLRD